jgi:co-chaperonin GroES (HSP10)
MKKIISIILAVFIAVVLIPYAVTSNEVEPIVVEFSHVQGFYDEEFMLELTSQAHEIYYTTDGSVPSVSSANSKEYTEPIQVKIGDSVDVFTINAVAVSAGEASDVFTHSYVKGKNVKKRFSSDTLIFSLSSDPHGLFDHHDGIFVSGIDREKWHEENPNEAPKPTADANFNRRGRESEREVHVTMFDSKGSLHISQNAGMRIKGGWSRQDSQKSLELYARNEYGKRNFTYPFFGELSHDGNFINRYRRVRLRNGGNDREFGFMRDEFSQEMFRKAGFPDTQYHTPAAVFLNGEYYGVAWLKSPRTENHWSRRYGGDEDSFQIIGGKEDADDGEEIAIEDWQEVFGLAKQGFSGSKGSERFSEFSERVCIDNLILYYAVQLYINNEDWPNNNVEMWRYVKSDGEKVKNPYLDGKWRFIAQDAEFAWNLYNPNKVNENTINNVLTGQGHMSGSSVILNAVLERDDMKAKLANTIVDLIEGAFNPETAVHVAADLIDRIKSEHNYALRVNVITPDNPDWPSPNGVGDSRRFLREFIQNRPDVMYNAIETTLGFEADDTYKVELSVGENGEAVMNSRPVSAGEKTVGNYYSTAEIAIKAKPFPDYVVDYWKVDGETVLGFNKEEIVAPANSRVELFFKKCPDLETNGSLRIEGVRLCQERNSYVVIHNPTEATLSTKGMFLSDSKNRKKWEMPAVNVGAGEELTIVMRDNENTHALKRGRAGFNISVGERLRLSDSDVKVVSRVEVTLMGENEIQKRRNDGKFELVKIEGDK